MELAPTVSNKLHSLMGYIAISWIVFWVNINLLHIGKFKYPIGLHVGFLRYSRF